MCVLRVCGFSEIGAAIVNAVMVYMVGDSAFANLNDFPVHLNDVVLGGISDWLVAYGVETASMFSARPFVFPEAVVVGRIDYGVGRLGEADSAESVAVAQPAIEQQGAYREFLQPNQNVIKFPDSYASAGRNSLCLTAETAEIAEIKKMVGIIRNRSLCHSIFPFTLCTQHCAMLRIRRPHTAKSEARKPNNQ